MPVAWNTQPLFFNPSLTALAHALVILGSAGSPEQPEHVRLYHITCVEFFAVRCHSPFDGLKSVKSQQQYNASQPLSYSVSFTHHGLQPHRITSYTLL
jgi:hypothetical protein